MKDFPSSEEILASTPHRPSVEIRLLAGIYDVLLEAMRRGDPSSDRPLITWRPAKRDRGSR